MKPVTARYHASTTVSSVFKTFVGERVLGRALPACVWALLTILKAATLVNRLSAASGVESPLAVAALAAQQSVAIAFTLLMVALFVARRPVVGPRATPVGAGVAIAGTWITFVPVARPPESSEPAILVLSTALIVTGVLVSLTSMLSLGRCFGIFPEARGLVTKGPYRWVRHPLYLGELVSVLGFVVASASTGLVVMLLCLGVLQYWRACNEERALARAFPEYTAYQRRSWRLIPGLH